MARVEFVLNWQFSRELPISVQAGASALKSSCALGDGWIQLKIWAPLG